MNSLLRQLGLASSWVLALGVLAGCDPGSTCSSTGTGTLVVQLGGVAAGATASFSYQTTAGSVNAAGPVTLTSVAAGSYTVRPGRAVAPGGLVRTVYAPQGGEQVVCVANGQTTTVTLQFAPVATSGRLWALNGTGGTGSMLGFAASDLSASGSPAAAPSASGAAGRAVAFDGDGNLWTVDPTSAGVSLQRYPAAGFASGGAKMADRSITVTGVSCLPAVSSLAFGPEGALWVASGCDLSVLQVAPSQLTASGSVSPSVRLTLPAAPTGLAFDATGNLWVAGEQVRRFDRASLGTSSAAPATTVSLKSPTAAGAALVADLLAFDPSGALWVTDFGGNSFNRVPTAALTGTGAMTLTAPVQVTVSVGALLEGFAFDEAGGLWTTFSQGSVARLAPAQLTTTTNAGAPTVPQTKLTSPDFGYAGPLAFFPGAAGTALYSAAQP